MEDLGFDPANLFDDAEGMTEGMTETEPKVKPRNHGRRWLLAHRNILERHFLNGDTVEQIACLQGRTNGAVIKQRDKLVIRDLIQALGEIRELPDEVKDTYQKTYQLTPKEMDRCYHQAVFQRYRLDHGMRLRNRVI